MDFQGWVRGTQRLLSENHLGMYLTQDQVDIVLRYALEQIKRELEEGGELSLVDIGRLYVVEQPARVVQGHLPGQQGAYEIPARRVVKFRAAKALKRLIE